MMAPDLLIVENLGLEIDGKGSCPMSISASAPVR